MTFIFSVLLFFINFSNAYAFGPKALPEELKGSTQYINDSLVQNLSCAQLSPKYILGKIRSDAFSAEKEIPAANWFDGDLAECWSLAHAQRIFFYLGRYNEPKQASSEDDALAILDMIRDGSPNKQGSDSPLYRMTVFNISNLDTLINHLSYGVSDGSKDIRTFAKDVEAYETKRFFYPSNAEFIGGERERSVGENQATIKEIMQDIDLGRMPMLILRAARTAQHVVLVKNYAKDEANQTIALTVYDSNNPGSNNYITYNISEGQFYGGRVVARFADDSYSPVGIFIVDEDDMDSIQNTLYNYYIGRCLDNNDQSTTKQK